MTPDHLYNNRVQFEVQTRTDDGYGGWTRVYDFGTGGVKCRINTIPTVERVAFMQAGRHTDHYIYANPRQAAVGNLAHWLQTGEKKRAVYTRDGNTVYLMIEGASDYDEMGTVYCKVLAHESDTGEHKSA